MSNAQHTLRRTIVLLDGETVTHDDDARCAEALLTAEQARVQHLIRGGCGLADAHHIAREFPTGPTPRHLHQ